MQIPTNPYRFETHKKVFFLISFVIMLAGLGVALLISKWSRLLGVALFLVGGAMLYFTNRIGPPSLTEKRGLIFLRDESGRLPILSERIMHYLTLKGRYPQITLITGIAIAGGVFFYNLYFQFNTYLGSNDYVMLLLAFSIGSYQYIPKKYSVERDFMLMFLFLLFLIVVIPTTYYSQKFGTTEGSWDDTNPDSSIIHYLLARPLGIILNTFFNISHVEVTGVLITYHDVDSNRLEVSIALGCTGLYSASIFLSAFISYILVEYRQFDSKVATLLTLGILTSYVANLFRMTIILMIGYYYGMDALLKAHVNVGELLFMFWIAIFWGLMFKYLDINVPWDQEETGVTAEASNGSRANVATEPSNNSGTEVATEALNGQGTEVTTEESNENSTEMVTKTSSENGTEIVTETSSESSIKVPVEPSEGIDSDAGVTVNESNTGRDSEKQS